MNIGDALIGAVTDVTKEWTTVKRKTIRDAARGARARERYFRHVRDDSIKEIAYRVMANAYQKASGNGKYPATARQVMYAARPAILAASDRPLDDVYFTQQLLPNYQREHPQQTATWDVVYDARGHLHEPHTDTEIALGTLDVRRYLASVRSPADVSLTLAPKSMTYPTTGPRHRYGHVLFLEKEGFFPLLEQAQIGKRFDVALMSTKGMSSTAARQLIERLSAEHDVRFLVLHDFDKSGFSICGTLSRSTDRYRFCRRPNVVDLGLRLADVEAEQIEAEPCTYTERDPAINLRRNGATNAEIAFLLANGGQRVELNAFTSDHFVTWLEGKLEAAGVEKLIPDDATLVDAYRRAVYVSTLNAELDACHETALAAAAAATVPDGLRSAVRDAIDDDPTQPWDLALASLVEEDEATA